MTLRTEKWNAFRVARRSEVRLYCHDWIPIIPTLSTPKSPELWWPDVIGVAVRNTILHLWLMTRRKKWETNRTGAGHDCLRMWRSMALQLPDGWNCHGMAETSWNSSKVVEWTAGSGNNIGSFGSIKDPEVLRSEAGSFWSAEPKDLVPAILDQCHFRETWRTSFHLHWWRGLSLAIGETSIHHGLQQHGATCQGIWGHHVSCGASLLRWRRLWWGPRLHHQEFEVPYKPPGPGWFEPVLGLDFHNFAPSCVGGGGFWWFLSRLLVRLGTEALSRELPRLGPPPVPRCWHRPTLSATTTWWPRHLRHPRWVAPPECLATYSKGHAELKEMMTRAEGRRPREQKWRYMKIHLKNHIKLYTYIKIYSV